MVKEIKDVNFQETIKNSDKPVIVDFWASWCGPCKMLTPVIEEISKELDNKVEFFKLNVDDNPEISTQYRVSSIPTLMVFKGGEMVDTLVGFRPKDSIKTVIEKHI